MIRSIRLVSIALPTWLVLVLPGGPGPAGPGVADAAGTLAPAVAAAPDPQAVDSALVTVAGPSVYETFVALSSAGDGNPRDGLSAVQVAEAATALAPELVAAEDRVRAAQAPVVAAAEALGVQVVSRYTTAANGLLVHATANQLRRLAAVPGVLRVEPAPRLRPDLAFSVPFIGADALAEATGYDGAGTTVAIVDTGIDYTHGDLAGPGDPAAYEAAIAKSDIISDTWQGQLLFPTEKVVGGWDFVGARYNPPWLCPPDQAAAGTCTTTPEPDPDPLDGWGHGSHVAGIVAGTGTASGSIAHGVAPGAKVVGLKIFSHLNDVDEEVDVVVDAIEWCTRVNLGLPVEGTPPPSGRVDAINMSIGEPWGQGSFLFDAAVEAAVGAGIAVVASAGNSGNLPFVVGAPSASPKILSVASSTAPTQAFSVTFKWGDDEADYPGSQGSATRPLEETGVVEGQLAWFGRGCTDDPVFEDVTERIALVERGACSFVQKIQAVQDAGAVAIIVFTDSRSRQGLAGSNDGIDISGVMIDRAPGLMLRDLLLDDQDVTARLDPAATMVDASIADAVSGFSSRGPSKNGALKPDITAPGSGIVSVRMGRGQEGVSFSGTSMSSPHAAGTAAVVQQRNVAEGLGLSGADVAALLMNYAVPTITDRGAGGTQLGVTRQGAGRIDVLRAGTGQVLLRAGDLASLHIGPVAQTGISRYVRRMTIRNLAAEPKRFRLAMRWRDRERAADAVRISVPDPIDVDAGAERELELVFRVDASALPPWPFAQGPSIAAAAMEAVALDGWMTLEELDARAQPVADAVNPHLPVYVLARRAAQVGSRGVPPVSDGATRVRFVNRSVFDGRAELLWAAGEDADEVDVNAELDLRHVGVRVVGPHADVTRTMVTFGVSLWEPAPVPFNTRLEIYIDMDRDGAADHRVRTGTERGLTGGGSRTAFLAAVAPWDPVSGTIGAEVVLGPQTVDPYSRVRTVTVPLEELGTDTPAPFDFYVVNRGLTEDWLHALTTDVAPDGAGADPVAMAGYSFDPAATTWQLDTWSVVVPGHRYVDVPLTPASQDGRGQLLALYPDNDFDPGDGQAAVLAADVPPPPEASTIYVPSALRGFEFYPLGPDELVGLGLDALAATPRFRMVYDLTDARDPRRSAYRQYEFDGDVGVDVVSRPKIGADKWQIRYRNQGYYHVRDIVWRCGPIEWYMFLRPELMGKLRGDFPATGWWADGRARNDPNLLQFRAADAAQGLSWLAQVPEGGGPAVVLTRTMGDVANPTERQVFRFRDFNGPDIQVGPPIGARCDAAAAPGG